MDVSVNYILSQAYDLIEVNRIDEARELLEPLLISHADDVDIWWLYAHSVNDPQRARQALDRVQALDPRRYPRAEGLLEDLDNTTSMIPMSLESLPARDRTSSKEEIPYNVDILDEEGDLDEDEDSEPSALVVYGLPLAVAIIATIVVVFSLLPRPSLNISTATLQNPTVITLDQVLTAPTIPITPTALIEAQSVATSLKFTSLPTIQKTTELGETLLFQLCIDEYDLSPSQLVNEVMEEVAQQLSSMTVESQAIGIELNYCQENALYRSVAVPIELAEQYNQGILTVSDYHRSIQAVE